MFLVNFILFFGICTKTALATEELCGCCFTPISDAEVSGAEVSAAMGCHTDSCCRNTYCKDCLGVASLGQMGLSKAPGFFGTRTDESAAFKEFLPALRQAVKGFKTFSLSSDYSADDRSPLFKKQRCFPKDDTPFELDKDARPAFCTCCASDEGLKLSERDVEFSTPGNLYRGISKTLTGVSTEQEEEMIKLINELQAHLKWHSSRSAEAERFRRCKPCGRVCDANKALVLVALINGIQIKCRLIK